MENRNVDILLKMYFSERTKSEIGTWLSKRLQTFYWVNCNNHNSNMQIIIQIATDSSFKNSVIIYAPSFHTDPFRRLQMIHMNLSYNLFTNFLKLKYFVCVDIQWMDENDERI